MITTSRKDIVIRPIHEILQMTLTLPKRRDIWLNPNPFREVRLTVWAKHRICGDNPAACEALTMFFALSVVTGMVAFVCPISIPPPLPSALLPNVHLCELHIWGEFEGLDF